MRYKAMFIKLYLRSQETKIRDNYFFYEKLLYPNIYNG